MSSKHQAASSRPPDKGALSAGGCKLQKRSSGDLEVKVVQSWSSVVTPLLGITLLARCSSSLIFTKSLAHSSASSLHSAQRRGWEVGN